MKVIVFLLVLVSNQAFTQQTASPRYVRYSRNEQNCTLFDTTLTYAFCKIAKGLIDKMVDEQGYYGYLSAGISPENVNRLRTYYKGTVPGLEWRLGKQSDIPLVNSYGEDSILYSPDGSASYVYPLQDTIFFMRCELDDIVIQEVYWTEAMDNTYWKPHTVFLRRVLFPGENPQVVAAFEWDKLYQVFYEYYDAVPVEQGKVLGLELERFLEDGARRFGSTWSYFDVSRWVVEYSKFRIPVSQELPDKLTIDEEWKALQALGEENGIYSETVLRFRNLKTASGADSVRFDPENNEEMHISATYIDTVLHVKKCFDTMYEYGFLVYDYESGWRKVVTSILVTKRIPGQSRPLLVNQVDLNSWSEYTPERKALHDFERDANPLRLYMSELPEEFIPKMEWQGLEKPGTFAGVVIRNL